MATPTENATLSTDAANAILAGIINHAAPERLTADRLKALAEAYSITVSAMPRPTKGANSA